MKKHIIFCVIFFSFIFAEDLTEIQEEKNLAFKILNFKAAQIFNDMKLLRFNNKKINFISKYRKLVKKWERSYKNEKKKFKDFLDEEEASKPNKVKFLKEWRIYYQKKKAEFKEYESKFANWENIAYKKAPKPIKIEKKQRIKKPKISTRKLVEVKPNIPKTTEKVVKKVQPLKVIQKKEPKDIEVKELQPKPKTPDIRIKKQKETKVSIKKSGYETNLMVTERTDNSYSIEGEYIDGHTITRIRRDIGIDKVNVYNWKIYNTYNCIQVWDFDVKWEMGETFGRISEFSLSKEKNILALGTYIDRRHYIMSLEDISHFFNACKRREIKLHKREKNLKTYLVSNSLLVYAEDYVYPKGDSVFISISYFGDSIENEKREYLLRALKIGLYQFDERYRSKIRVFYRTVLNRYEKRFFQLFFIGLGYDFTNIKENTLSRENLASYSHSFLLSEKMTIERLIPQAKKGLEIKDSKLYQEFSQMCTEFLRPVSNYADTTRLVLLREKLRKYIKEHLGR